MRLRYDLDADALYIEFSDHTVARTQQVDDNALVDLDEAGNVIGIEVTSIGHPWPLHDILSTYSIPEAEAAQLRAYFPPWPGRGLGTPQLSTARIPAVSTAA